MQVRGATQVSLTRTKTLRIWGGGACCYLVDEVRETGVVSRVSRRALMMEDL